MDRIHRHDKLSRLQRWHIRGRIQHCHIPLPELCKISEQIIRATTIHSLPGRTRRILLSMICLHVLRQQYGYQHSARPTTTLRLPRQNHPQSCRIDRRCSRTPSKTTTACHSLHFERPMRIHRHLINRTQDPQILLPQQLQWPSLERRRQPLYTTQTRRKRPSYPISWMIDSALRTYFTWMKKRMMTICTCLHGTMIDDTSSLFENAFPERTSSTLSALFSCSPGSAQSSLSCPLFRSSGRTSYHTRMKLR